MASDLNNVKEVEVNLIDYVIDLSSDPQNYAFFDVQESMTWHHKEFDFTKDKEDYENENTPKGLKRLLKLVIGFILVGDGLIAEDLLPLIQKAVADREWCLAMGLIKQLDMEITHNLTYRKALSIFPLDEHQEIIESVNKLDCVKSKGLWLKENVDRQESLGLKYMALAAGEGIFFVFLFCMIFLIRSYNDTRSLFKAFVESNEQISKDETLHRTHKAFMAKRLLKDDEKARALEIVKEAVEIEKMHAQYVLTEPVFSKQADEDFGITVENLNLYIEKLADDILHLSGLGKYYHSNIDLKWMTDILLSQKSNFYEREVIGSYRATEVGETVEDGINPVKNPELVMF